MNRIILSALFLLSGCSYLGIKSTPEAKPKLNIENPGPLNLGEFEVVLINKNNTGKVFTDLEKVGKVPVIVGMDSENYKVMILNYIKLRDYIELLQDILNKYREYYEGFKSNGKRQED